MPISVQNELVRYVAGQSVPPAIESILLRAPRSGVAFLRYFRSQTFTDVNAWRRDYWWEFYYFCFMDESIKNNLDAIIATCKKHQVKSISLFGSAAKDTMHEESDIDLLVEFSKDIDVLEYADNYFSLLEQLQDILKKKVDLVSSRSLKNPILKEMISQSKVELYAAQTTQVNSGY